MWFSASASFLVGTSLLAVGTATLHKVTRKSELPFRLCGLYIVVHIRLVLCCRDTERSDLSVFQKGYVARYGRERLVNLPLMLRAYGFLDLLEAAAAMAAFFFVLQRGGWNYGVALDWRDPYDRGQLRRGGHGRRCPEPRPSG
ncbi:MAG: hypothetical protein IPN63_05310 [Gammaproteobacteria bacterium]|nr:hypothetical protein [Gammaproteobacteria bacterium]MBK9426844.1 hypothetical protein [Gammaproteobacteria bacterium]